MIWGIVIALVVVVGAVFAALRWRKTEEKPDFLFRVNCPRCKQRVGYRKHQIGHKAMCPNCFQDFAFPAEAAAPKPPDEQ